GRGEQSIVWVFAVFGTHSAGRKSQTPWHNGPGIKLIMDFWQHSGYQLLERAADGHLLVTDDYLRLYYARPELAPVAESCAAERHLHAALLEAPRRAVGEAEITALADSDAQENYRVMLRFRDQLLAAPTLEAFYFSLFRQVVAVPP